MKILTLTSVAAIGVLSAVVTIPFHTGVRAKSSELILETRMTTSLPGRVQVYFDDGLGLREELASSERLSIAGQPVVVRLRVPEGRFTQWRFDPIDNPARVELAPLQLLGPGGKVERTFALAELEPVHQIASAREEDGRLVIEPTAGANDPQLMLRFSTPLDLRLSSRHPAWRLALHVTILWSLGLALLFALQRSPRPAEWWRQGMAWIQAHPTRGLAIAAAVASLLSTYPVVFMGRSYVSPNFSDGTYLLYPWFPTLPGYSNTVTENAKGSDVGAMAWQHIPYTMVQHQALFENHELPLWNRNNSAGNPLLGQGQSMVGDPLNLIPLLANGAAWAWDLKYILAKWLFGLGLALIVWHATRFMPAALLTAVSSVFIGFFLYRVNHPAIFSLCWSPWILYAWLRLVQAGDRYATTQWVGVLIAANWCEMTSGTAKEAFMILLCLQVTGVLLLLIADLPARTKVAKLLVAGGGGLLFAMLSAPLWSTFLQTLRQSHTNYDSPSALQIHPALLLGFLDEIFFRPIHKGENVWNPSVNFLAGTSVLYLLATWRRCAPDRVKLALVLGAIPSLALAFGFIPPRWIMQVPFVANIGHIDNTFSCVLIIHVLVLAGIGCKVAAERLRNVEAFGDLGVTVVLLAVVVMPYLALMHTVHREPFGANTVLSFLDWGQVVPVKPFVWWSLIVLPAATLVLGLSVWRIQRGSRHIPALAILTVTCGIIVFWRHGAHAWIGFDDYTFNPAARVDLHAPSAAIAAVRAARTEPYRVVGIDGVLMAGWSSAYDLEGPGGADAVVNRWYRELLHACRVELAWDWVVPARLETLQRDRRFFDLLNVRYFLHVRDDPARLAPGLQRIDQAELDVYVSPTAWPRAFFTDRLARYERPEDFGQLVFDGDGRPFAAMQLTDPTPQLSADLAGRTVVPAGEYRLTANTTAFTVAAPSPGIIVLQEAWWAGDFQVTVNGERREYVRVNHAFKGVVVDAPGTYEIKFSYWPRYFTASLVAAFIALVAIGVIAFRLRRTRGPA